jgi:hypothetical protein
MQLLLIVIHFDKYNYVQKKNFLNTSLSWNRPVRLVMLPSIFKVGSSIKSYIIGRGLYSKEDM